MLLSNDLQLNYKEKYRLGFSPIIHICMIICHYKLYRESESAVIRGQKDFIILKDTFKYIA